MKIKPIPASGIVGEVALKEAAAGEFRSIIDLVRAAIQAKLYPGENNRYVPLAAVYADRAVVDAGDGRQIAYPYTLADDNQVQLGAPVEVVMAHVAAGGQSMTEAANTTSMSRGPRLDPIGEAQNGVFVEAQDEKGLRWMIRVIRAGLSGNRNYYPDAVLREAVPLFDGARVLVRNDEEHLADTGKGFRNLIGRLTAPTFVEGKRPDSGEIRAVLELLETAGEVPAKLREAWSRGMADDLFGFSIDAKGKAKAVDGKRVAQKITKVNSVDLIIEPGAGGQLINLIEAQDPNVENDDMKLSERMIEAIKKANGGKLPDGLDTTNDEQLEAAYREAIATKPSVEAKTKPAEIVTKDDLRMVEARAHLRAAVAGSNLPEHARDRVRAMFADKIRFTEAEVDKVVKDEREYLAKFTESGKPAGVGDIRIEAGENRAEKVGQMLDAFFDPAHKEHRKVRSFKECYIAITGDRLVTGRIDNCDRALLRESLGADLRESLDTTAFSNVLGNTIARRLVAEYNAAADYDGWRRISNVVPVGDFRSQERVRFGGYGDLPTVAQGAGYAALTSPTDEKASYSIAKKGGTEDITLEMIKNDDVGSIQRIPVKLGRAAKRTLAKFVLDFIKDNPTVYDSVALFHATHGNLGSAALDVTSLAARRLAMLKQAEKDSADRLGIGPKSLLVPLDLQQAAVDLFKLSTNNEKNFIQSLVLDIIPVWYWTDATDWALATDPRDIPGLEVGFLDGNEEPELFVQDNPTVGSMFSNDKLTYKIRHIYGGAITDYRAFDKSVVA